MACLMLVPVALLMLLFMPAMYPSKRLNSFIMGAGATVLVGALALLRTQTFINDTRFMESMMPHHFIAILVSERANIRVASSPPKSGK